MESLVLVHEDFVTGPVVAGAASWSTDWTVLIFRSAAPLSLRMSYSVHLSPSIRGANGHPLDIAACARLGGQSVTSGMMGKRWRAAHGTFGMIFTFTTA